MEKKESISDFAKFPGKVVYFKDNCMVFRDEIGKYFALKKENGTTYWTMGDDNKEELRKYNIMSKLGEIKEEEIKIIDSERDLFTYYSQLRRQEIAYNFMRDPRAMHGSHR